MNDKNYIERHLDLLPEVFTQSQLAKLAKVSTRRLSETIHLKLIQIDRQRKY